VGHLVVTHAEPENVPRLGVIDVVGFDLRVSADRARLSKERAAAERHFHDGAGSRLDERIHARGRDRRGGGAIVVITAGVARNGAAAGGVDVAKLAEFAVGHEEWVWLWQWRGKGVRKLGGCGALD
jgi:hypothetical protein